VLIPALASLCVGSVACGSLMCAATVDLQDTADLQFYTYSPPILRGATVTSALEFLCGRKGAKSPLLDFIMHTLWPSFCDEAEILHALELTWSSLIDDAARARFQNFLAAFVQENHKRFNTSNAFGAQLRDWLVSTSQATALKVYHALPALHSALGSAVSDAVKPLPLGRSAVDLLLYSPETAAEQLTLIDHRILAPVSASELLGRGWTKKEKDVLAPGVMGVIARFNTFSDFVRSDIVMGRDIATRSRRLKFWVDVQKQCFNLNNFHSVMALSGALNSVPVRKLLKLELVELKRRCVCVCLCLCLRLCAEAKRSHRRWLEFVEEQFRSRNMSGYRTKLAAVLKGREPAIPFLATHLGDLIFIHEGNPDVLEGGLVNMWKRYQVARQLSGIRQMQDTSYNALKKVDELYRHLLTVWVEWDERKVRRSGLAPERLGT
jgi:hypothetical protein